MMSAGAPAASAASNTTLAAAMVQPLALGWGKDKTVTTPMPVSAHSRSHDPRPAGFGPLVLTF